MRRIRGIVGVNHQNRSFAVLELLLLVARSSCVLEGLARNVIHAELIGCVHRKFVRYAVHPGVPIRRAGNRIAAVVRSSEIVKVFLRSAGIFYVRRKLSQVLVEE